MVFVREAKPTDNAVQRWFQWLIWDGVGMRPVLLFTVLWFLLVMAVMTATFTLAGNPP